MTIVNSRIVCHVPYHTSLSSCFDFSLSVLYFSFLLFWVTSSEWLLSTVGLSIMFLTILLFPLVLTSHYIIESQVVSDYCQQSDCLSCSLPYFSFLLFWLLIILLLLSTVGLSVMFLTILLFPLVLTSHYIIVTSSEWLLSTVGLSVMFLTILLFPLVLTSHYIIESQVVSDYCQQSDCLSCSLPYFSFLLFWLLIIL